MYSLQLCAFSVGLWCDALFQPAFVQRETGTTVYTGLQCLLLGWWGLFGIFKWAIPWLANVFYWIGMVGAVRPQATGKVALVISLIAVPLALVTFANKTIAIDEAGNTAAVSIGPAFYLWLASMLLLVAAHAVADPRRITDLLHS